LQEVFLRNFHSPSFAEIKSPNISPSQEEDCQSNSPDIFLIFDVARREFNRVLKNMISWEETWNIT